MADQKDIQKRRQEDQERSNVCQAYWGEDVGD